LYVCTTMPSFIVPFFLTSTCSCFLFLNNFSKKLSCWSLLLLGH
jgi:hypothetical protein